MGSTIQPLPVEVVNLIAAGEVIDSLAAVVRELVENAIDAGATRIVVSVWPELWRVRVADNGMGMDLADLQQAAIAHSTSKIHHREDLWKITSLGFRGEALHSLTQLAELEIISRKINSPEAWRVVYNAQGETIEVEPAAIAPGTIVTISNLFGSWTIRRQGLPTPAQQLRTVQATINQIAICHPQITWKIQQEFRDWFTISPGITAQHILPQIIRDVSFSDLQQLKIKVPSGHENQLLTDDFITESTSTTEPKSDAEIEVILGLPDRCHRRRPDWVKVAVNKRIVRSPELEQILINGFARTLPRDRYPLCFLHLEICPSQIDWNRHPAKTEIYLHHLSYWQTQIASVIEQALRLNQETITETALTGQVSKLIKAAEAKSGYHVNRTITNTSTDRQGWPGIELRAIAQVRQTYILAEYPDGAWLVEQHIAHERVLYEQLCDRWQLVSLEPPIILNQLSPAQLDQLQRIGIEVEPFGEQLWAVRNAPESLARRADCSPALLELSLGGDLQTAQVATACRTAIRNGTKLNLEEMQTLLNQWQQTRNPRTCPHGRPIYLSLAESHLARFFRRHWVIGKSHGI